MLSVGKYLKYACLLFADILEANNLLRVLRDCREFRGEPVALHSMLQSGAVSSRQLSTPPNPELVPRRYI
jgi:hypothetical protein